ncbi:MAG: translation initiation factor IF-2 [Planctomycetota bacterium]
MGERIHKLAKELDLSSTELVALLRKKGIKIASHLSCIDDDVAEALRREAAAPRPAASGSSPAKGAAVTKPAPEAKSNGGPKPAPGARPGAGGVRPVAAGAAGSSPGAAQEPPKPKETKKLIIRPAPIQATPRPAVRRPLIVRSSSPPPPAPAPPQERDRDRDRDRGGPPAYGRDRAPGGGGGGRDNRPFSPPPPDPPPMAPDDGRPRGKRVRVFTEGGDLRGAGRSGPGAGKRGGGRGQPGGGAGQQGGRGRGRSGGFGSGSMLAPPRRRAEALSSDRPSEVTITLPMTLKDLSAVIGVKLAMLIAEFMRQKIIANANQTVSREMLDIISNKFEVKIHAQDQVAIDSELEDIETAVDDKASMVPRAPVVTLMGHVDHGKTSLLDRIRETRVQKGESGGITQHMSAYRVDYANKHVVFIDTPGHQAFSQMRARSANVTDVAVLVVAADDGVMPQTIEAIQHAQAASVPIVVAINKIDKQNANVGRTKQQLATHDLSPREWGGKTEMVEVSALTDQGIDDLLDLLTLETEILELRANPSKDAIGTVLDARQAPGRGKVVTVLVQDGTLRRGDNVICGTAVGRVRTLQTTTGIVLQEAGPATPVDITGLDEFPEAGDRFYVLADAVKAKNIAEDRKRRKRELERATREHVTLATLQDSITRGKIKEVKLVVKADVKGSLEVIRKQLEELGSSEVGVKVIGYSVGEISESDVTLADASDAIILGFHVAANSQTKRAADAKGVEIRTYEVIYELLEDIRLSLEGLLDPELYEEAQSRVEVVQLFKSSRLGSIAGCMVRSGVLRREDKVRVHRDGKLMIESSLESLKRFKDDAKEVREGFDCGCRVAGFEDLQVGDIIESYKVLKKARTLADLRKS